MDRTALVVDDDPVSLMLMCQFLNDQNWQTLSAKSVLEAQDILSSQPPIDWLVLDDHLPDGSSEDILDYVAIYLNQETWIVRVSGSDAPAPIEQAWHAFAPKPWSSETVERLLGRWERRDGEEARQEMIIIDPKLLPLFDAAACEKAFRKRPQLWFRVREGVERRLPQLLLQFREGLAALREESVRGERRALQNLAHEIKGQLKMLRSLSLAENARALEDEAESAPAEALLLELDTLEAKLPALRLALDDFESGLHASL